MCGIAGIWTEKKPATSVLSKYIHKMNSRISRRGPDGEGYFLDEGQGLALGHRRLSIIDLTNAGSQPMHSRSGRYIISFNGEIYNHRLLSSLIQGKGQFSPIGTSDTEILVNSIEILGLVETLEIASGMFAFALWDRLSQCLHLVRDRFGEKPLFWAHVNNSEIGKTLAFCSDPRGLREIWGAKPPEICIDALTEYFRYGYIPYSKCIYKGIEQLKPGEMITFAHERSLTIKRETWWNPVNEASKSKVLVHKKDSLLEVLESMVSASIQEQICADVPVCILLSGGIDSSLIAALARKNTSSDLNTFTVGFDATYHGADALDETIQARHIAEHLGTNHTEIVVSSADALKMISNMPEIYSQPFADSSQLPFSVLCRELRTAGFKVALTGDGSDELFGGYDRYRMLLMLCEGIAGLSSNALDNLLLTFLKLQSLGRGSTSRVQRLRSILNLKRRSPLEVYNQLQHLISDDALSRLMHITNIPAQSCVSFDDDILLSAMLNDYANYLPCDILVKSDRASMFYGLETRAPFLSTNIARFAWGLDTSHKIPNPLKPRSTKKILRELLSMHLPRQLIKARKQGFTPPIAGWLRGPLKNWASDILQSHNLLEDGYLDPAFARGLWADHIDNKADNSRMLWNILMWLNWRSKYG